MTRVIIIVTISLVLLSSLPGSSADLLEKDDLVFSLKKCNAELLSLSSRPFPAFLKNSEKMLKDERFVDLFLRSGNDIFPAHRIILASTSPVFSSLIYNETLLNKVQYTLKNNESFPRISWSDIPPPGEYLVPSGAMTVLQIDDDINGATVQEMLRFIYTGKVENISQVAGQLIVAADRYGLAELKQLCERVILGQVKLDNSIEMFKLARDVHSKKLRRKAFDVMKANGASSSLPSGQNATMVKMNTTRSDGHPIIAKIFYIKQKQLFKPYHPIKAA